MNYRNTMHGVHLLLTLLTGGAWAIIWLWRGLANAQHNRTVDRERLFALPPDVIRRRGGF